MLSQMDRLRHYLRIIPRRYSLLAKGTECSSIAGVYLTLNLRHGEVSRDRQALRSSSPLPTLLKGGLIAQTNSVVIVVVVVLASRRPIHGGQITTIRRNSALYPIVPNYLP
jgi:hypothetical protein